MTFDQARWERRQARRMARMQWRANRSPLHGVTTGLIIIAVGTLFLLQNLGFLYIDSIWRFWPVLLIAFGVSKLVRFRWVPGLVLVTIGAVFLLRNLGYIYGDVWRFLWPLILIGVGAGVLLRNLGSQRSWPGNPTNFNPANSVNTSENQLDLNVEFHHLQQTVDAQDFVGGRVKVLFGGVELDLRNAHITREAIVIKADALFGGIEIRVPETWNTIVRGSGVFGGYTNLTYPSPNPQPNAPRLIVTGSAVFGGMIVKN